MEVEVDRIQAEPIDTQIQPETHVVELCLTRFRVVEVDVRLAGQEVVQIVLLAPGVEGPRRAAKNRQPVVGRRAVGFRVGPHKPVGFRIGAILAALLEPGVLIGGMADHLVDHHFQAQRVSFFQQRLEVVQGAEHRVYVAVVTHVIAKVEHRRGEKGR